MTDATLRERFEAKVIKNDDGCWGWLGAMWDGRPRIWMEGRVRYGYQASWVLHFGPIPEGMNVCHHCDNGACCRPDHLFIGTHTDNMRDALEKGRSALGERHGNARLTEKLVRYIREQRRLGRSQRAIAEEIGVVRGTVEFVDQGKTWRHVA